MELNPDEMQAIVKRLKRAQGQIGGILKMIDDGRECQDIVTQRWRRSPRPWTAKFAVIALGLRQCIVDPDSTRWTSTAWRSSSSRWREGVVVTARPVSTSAADWDRRYGGADLVVGRAERVGARAVRGPAARVGPRHRCRRGAQRALAGRAGWDAVATDFSAVGVARMGEIADRRLGDRRGAFTAVVADATGPQPRPPSGLLVESGAAGLAGGHAGGDLVVDSVRAGSVGAARLPAPAARAVACRARGCRGCRRTRWCGARRRARPAQPHRGGGWPAGILVILLDLRRGRRQCRRPSRRRRARQSCASGWCPAQTARPSTRWCCSGKR